MRYFVDVLPSVAHPPSHTYPRLQYVAQMHEASAERTFPRPSRVQDRYMVGPMHHQRYVGIGYDPLRPPHTIPHDCTTPIVVLADILVLGGAGCLGGPPDSQRHSIGLILAVISRMACTQGITVMTNCLAATQKHPYAWIQVSLAYGTR